MSEHAARLFGVSSFHSASGDEWYTPRWLFEALGLTFDVDVCAPIDREMVSTPARRFLTIDDDGLSWVRLT